MVERDLNGIQPGTRVYSSDDEHVGDVEEVGPNYLRAHTGWFFGKTRYIPFAVVGRVESDGVYLTLAKAEIDAMAWDAPPAETAGTGVFAADTGAQRTTGAELNAVTPPITHRDAAVPTEQPAAHVESTGPAAFQERTFEVRARHEEFIVDKRARVIEEIVVLTHSTERTEMVQETVRRTRVDIEEVAGQTTEAATASTASATASTVESVVDPGTGNTRKGSGKRGRRRLPSG